MTATASQTCLATWAGGPRRTLLLVKLDDPKFGGGPGTVIAHVSSVAEYFERVTDRDGARADVFRLWEGDFPVGARVQL